MLGPRPQDVWGPADQWRNLLLVGADLIEKHGWARSEVADLQDVSHGLCMITAVRIATDQPVLIRHFEKMFGAYLTHVEMYNHLLEAERRLTKALGDVENWNDFQCPSKKGAVAKLREIACKKRKR